jgi:hypothetical protein
MWSYVTSVCDLNLLVYETLSYLFIRTHANSVCNLNLTSVNSMRHLVTSVCGLKVLIYEVII